MPTVLALEPDPAQAAALERIVRDRVGAEFVLAESKDQAMAALRGRIPDLILLTAFISPRDETDIADLIRETDGADHTQTLTIPLLDVGSPKPARKKKRGLLSALTGEAADTGSPAGCDPALFAEEITNYLHQAEHARAEAAARHETRARKPRRKKRETTGPQARQTAELDAPAPSSSYWSWDAPADGTAEASPEVLEAPRVEIVDQAIDVSPDTDTTQTAPEMEDGDAPAGSSWANPWDVSAPSVVAAESASQDTYLDDLIIPGPDPVLANGADTVTALFEQPAAPSAADLLARPAVRLELFAVAAEPTIVKPEPVAAVKAIEAPALPDAPAAMPEPSMPHESEIIAARLPTRAESATLLALQADVARLRQQRATTDATLVAAKAAQERATRAASEAAVRARQEADRRAGESAARAKEEALAERKAREAAEKRAAEEAERRADAERRVRDAAERARQEAERQARLDADQRIEAERRRAREDAERQANVEAERRIEAERRKVREQAERLARQQADERLEAERRAREEAERRAESERLAREEAERRAKEDTARLEREARERRAHAEAERKAREAAEAHAAAERKAREQAEKSAREQAERLAREAAREAARKAQEEADVQARKAAAEADRTRKEAEARAREEAAAERHARQLAEQRALDERKAREESERRAEIERGKREQAEQAAAAARAEAVARPKKAAPVRKSKKSSARSAAPAKPRKRPAAPRSVQDEWGLYDPNAAGFEALFAKLESIENGEEDPPPPPRRMPRPLAMWATQLNGPADPQAGLASKSGDEFRALVSQFSIPHAVASVSYAKGARIHNVDVGELPDGAVEPDAQVVILSRRLLKEVRQTASK